MVIGIKNHPHLIASLIEHVFVQVLDVPKPRPVPKQEAKRLARVAAAEKRRADREAKEADEKKKRQEQWIAFKSGSSGPEKASAASQNSDKAANKNEFGEQLYPLVVNGLEARGKKDTLAGKVTGMLLELDNSEISHLLESPGSLDEKLTEALDVLTKAFGSPDEEHKDAKEEEDEAVLDRDVGLSFEEAVLHQKCYWQDDDKNCPLEYQLQVELSLTLARLAEQFAAASLSIQHSRSFDAVCTVVPGVICAIADALLRRRASDRPSEFCCILQGSTVDGIQLGVAGFGTTVSTFAEQTETMEIHCPELSVARTAVIDYFQSPLQQRLDKV